MRISAERENGLQRRTNPVLKLLRVAYKVTQVLYIYVFPAMFLAPIMRREGFSPALVSGIRISAWVLLLLGFFCNFAYSSCRTCPECGKRLSYDELKDQPGGRLICPHCQKEFPVKLVSFEWINDPVE